MILQPVVEPMEHYTALDNTMLDRPGLRVCSSLIEVLITALVYNGGNVMSEVCYFTNNDYKCSHSPVSCLILEAAAVLCEEMRCKDCV